MAPQDEWREPIVIVTAFLVIVGLFQLRLFWVQLKFIRESLIDAKESADAATIAANAATRQAKAAEDTLDKKERPYLFVFGARYFNKTEFGIWYVTFGIGNYGVMPAIIDEAFFEVVLGRNDPPSPGYADKGHSIFQSGVLAPKETRVNMVCNVSRSLISKDSGSVIVVTTDSEPKGIFPIPLLSLADGEAIFFRIIVNYHGPFSKGHETEATWKYEVAFSEFIPWGGTQYNRTV